jgi:hypothetical protein
MPEFILDYGSPEAAREFVKLDEFTRGYIEAMFFTDTSSADDGELEHATFADLAPEALATIIRDCTTFQSDYRADIDEAIDTGRINGYDAMAAGRDYWYTRNGHGCGYWDRGLGDIGDKLTTFASIDPQVDLYLGDDERIYIS